MARTPNRTMGPVGYGRKGRPFYSQRNYNIASAEAKLHNRQGPSRMKPRGMPPIGTHRKKA